MKPRILLSTLNKSAQNYVDALEACGALADAYYLPTASADEYDALLLCGGGDIDPKYYGAETNGSVRIDEVRDACEFALLEQFVKAKKPILGICRGHQVLNVYFGGDMIQHLPTADAHKNTEHTAVHDVAAVGESVLSRLYGNDFAVNSVHHQAVGRLGENLRVTLQSKADGVVEAIEHATLPILGVQFHPERMCLNARRDDTVDGIGIFQHFVELCQK